MRKKEELEEELENEDELLEYESESDNSDIFEEIIDEDSFEDGNNFEDEEIELIQTTTTILIASNSTLYVESLKKNIINLEKLLKQEKKKLKIAEQ